MSLINPTLNNVDQYLDELMDKQGSDYFPLPIKLDRFIAKTYDFIRSNLVYMDANQTISDDIRPLIVERSDFLINKSPSKGIYHIPVPEDYHRLITTYPLLNGTKICREVTILKNGQESYSSNPFRKATDEYVNVFRIGDNFEIHCSDKSDLKYNSSYIKYCREPIFAKENELEKKIVDLPIQSIIQICNITADSFRFTTSDTFAQQNEAFNSKFGKKNRT